MNRNYLRGRRLVGLLGALGLALWLGSRNVPLNGNYHEVLARRLYRSAQLSAAGFEACLERDGIRTVLNLRAETNEAWHAQERRLCANRAVTYLDFPLAGDQAPSREQTTALVALLNKAEPPLLVHCQHGADRTAFAVALYLAKVAGEPEQKAQSAFSLRYGHLWFTREGCFDRAFHDYVNAR